MGIKRIVDTDFWTDGKVEDFSPEDRYFMLYLMTNPFTTQLGIYELKVKQAAVHLGYSTETIYVLLERFEQSYDLVKFSKETKEIAIKNYLRHSIIKGGAPVHDCLVKEIRKVKNKDLIAWVFTHIKDYENLNETVKNIIKDYENENGILHYCNENKNDKENDNENDNDNDNDCIVPRIVPRIVKPQKHKYGEYKNVLLTDDELQKIKTEYSDWEDRIERLSSYVASTGKSYKSHYATIRNWARKDKEQPKKTYFSKEETIQNRVSVVDSW